ncbi:hypothetical protein EBT25_12320 [bacterium]|nr:hypothetical protein [bacterium]
MPMARRPDAAHIWFMYFSEYPAQRPALNDINMDINSAKVERIVNVVLPYAFRPVARKILMRTAKTAAQIISTVLPVWSIKLRRHHSLRPQKKLSRVR